MHKEYQMPTQGQIDNWKNQHGHLHKIVVKVPGESDAICIVRPPKISDITQSSNLGEGDSFKIGNIQLTNCWLHGDERIRKRFSIKKAAVDQMSMIFQVYPFTVESVKLNEEILKSLNDSGIDPAILLKVKEEGMVRKVTILNGAKAEMVEDKESPSGFRDKREKIEAYFQCPDLSIIEKVNTMTDFIDQGIIYINESFLYGDKRFKDGSDEHVSFAAFRAGHSLVEHFTTEVEKL